MERKNFELLMQLFGGEITPADIPDYKQSVSEPYMNLSMDRLFTGDKAGSNKASIALAHNLIVNGDVCADPDMQMVIDFDAKTVRAYTFEQWNPPMFTMFDPDDKSSLAVARIKGLNEFLNTWLKNLISQGHSLK